MQQTTVCGTAIWSVRSNLPLFSDRCLNMQGTLQSLSATQEPQVSPPPPSRNTTPVPNHSLCSNTPTHSVATAGYRTKSRPLPTKKGGAFRTVESLRKRKHALKSSRAERRYEDSGSEGDGGVSGDGSSSGDSIPSQASAHQKRQQTSQIATRSSTRITGARGVSRSEDPMDVDVSPRYTPPAEEDCASTDSNCTGTDNLIVTHCHVETDVSVTTNTEDHATTNTNNPVAANANSPVTANAGSPPSANTSNLATNDEDSTITSSKNPAIAGTVLSTTTRSVFSPASLDDIDEANVPTFLLRHGKGKWEVNIFGYLHKVNDPRFQRVLFHYLRFEINNQSKPTGSLPTVGRPIEIGQWSSRARPSNLPEYTKGGRSLMHFADSVFEWWARIQPS